MNIGIIGHEAAKFTPATTAKALHEIEGIIRAAYARDLHTTVVSGHCHLGGIDIWAEEMADRLGSLKLIFPPAHQRWEPDGYRARNIRIAETSDIVYNIVVSKLPETYSGMRFKCCYHCDRPQRKHIQVANTQCAHPADADHIKSGGCWTAWYALEKCGKPARWIVL